MALANKKAKMRTCIACRQCKDKLEFFKITRQGDEILADIEQKLFGRSAYICKSLECIEKAQRADKLAGSFRRNIDKKIYIELKEALDEQ